MNSLLLIIDLQNQFINKNTEHVIEKINTLLDENKYDKVVFTRFINSIDNILYKKINYRGCMEEESQRIVIDTKNNEVIDKPIYSCLNDELKKYINDNDINEIFICGIDSECCVLKTALDMFENDYNLYILKDYCACISGDKNHDNAMNILKRNIGENRVI